MTNDDALFGYRQQVFAYAERTHVSEACRTWVGTWSRRASASRAPLATRGRAVDQRRPRSGRPIYESLGFELVDEEPRSRSAPSTTGLEAHLG